MLIFPRVCRSPIPISSRQVFTLPVLFHSTLFFSDDYPLFLHNGQSTTFGINCSPFISCHCTQLLSFHTLARSFALIKNSTLLFSSNSELFYKKHPGGVWGQRKIANGETRTWRGSPIRPGTQTCFSKGRGNGLTVSMWGRLECRSEERPPCAKSCFC